MTIRLATSHEEYERCYPVMSQLRPDVTAARFAEVVVEQRAAGYHLVYLEHDGVVVAVAGFRLETMLSRATFMYVDDLVTDAGRRSEGHGEALFLWLVEHARSLGCASLDLDSGVQRHAAHRFYFRQRMRISAYHFRLDLEDA